MRCKHLALLLLVVQGFVLAQGAATDHSLADITDKQPKLLAAASRRTLQDTTTLSDCQTTQTNCGPEASPGNDDPPVFPRNNQQIDDGESEGSGFAETDLGDTFFGWFVLVGVAWCIYHGCKPGGCCRPHSSSQQAQPQPTAEPVGTHQMAQAHPGQQWTQAIDPRTGLAVAHVHIAQQAPVESSRVTRPNIQAKDVPKRLYRIGVQRWSEKPVENSASDSKPAAAAQHAELSDVVGGGSSGIERYHSVASTGAAESSVYLPPAISEGAASAPDTVASSPDAALRPAVATSSQHSSRLEKQDSVQNSGALGGAAGGGSIMSERECVICYERVADHVLVPCGHGGFCGPCAKEMCSGHAAPYTVEEGHVCPVCRAPVDAVVKVSPDTKLGQASNAERSMIIDHAAAGPAPEGPQQGQAVNGDFVRVAFPHNPFPHPHGHLMRTQIVAVPSNARGTNVHYMGPPPPGFPPR